MKPNMMVYTQMPHSSMPSNMTTSPYDWYTMQHDTQFGSGFGASTTAGSYSMNNMTVYDHSALQLSTSDPYVYSTPSYLLDPGSSVSPMSMASPATPLSTSYEPFPMLDQNMFPDLTDTKFPENICPYPDCQSKGRFKRKTDLNRHIKTQHQAEENMIDCSYGWCGRTGKNGFSRADHLREHRREVHREKIPYKTTRTERGSLSPSTSRAKQHRISAATATEPRTIPRRR